MSWTTPKTWATGEMITADLMNQQVRDNLSYLYTMSLPVAILQDVKATNVGGGNSLATTWNPRDLNTEILDPDNIVSLSSNLFTPIAGKYISVIETSVTHGNGDVVIRLYNYTNGAVVSSEGINLSSALSYLYPVSTFTTINYFATDGTKSYRVEMFTEAAVTSGLGTPKNIAGQSERYTQVTLVKVG